MSQTQTIDRPTKHFTQQATQKPHLVVYNDPQWRWDESKNSQTIANAQRPLVIITDNAAKHIGTIGRYFSGVFDTIPYVFESIGAQKTTRLNNSFARPAFQNVSIGTVEIDKTQGAKHDSIINSSDCIIVMGSPSDTMRRELCVIKRAGKVVVINETPRGTTPQAGVNLAEISSIKSTHGVKWDPQWLTLTKSSQGLCM